MASYSLAGYTPPAGVDSRQKVKEYQTRLGVAADGIWGPKTQAAYEASTAGGRNDWSTPASIYGGYYDQALSMYAPPTIQAYTPPRAGRSEHGGIGCGCGFPGDGGIHLRCLREGA